MLEAIQAERQQRLQEKLRQLYASYDLETRVDERMRLEAIIETTKKDLQTIGTVPTSEHIHSDRLPTVKGGFFGREV